MRLFELAQPITESEKGVIVFTFGRFNPPTIGHQQVINTVAEVAAKENANHIVYLSKTHKPGKDPLAWSDKYALFRKMFPNTNVSRDQAIINPYTAMETLGKDYNKVIMVVGSDRADRFRGDMEKYLEGWGIEEFEVVSAGDRDPDAEGVEGMSASKARALAVDGDFKGFSQALPSTISNATKKSVYSKIRQNQ